MTKHTILFLAANPLGTDPLALDEEARLIRMAFERSGQRDKFELVTRWAVQPMDLLHELRRQRPTVVHFSGHGGRDESGHNGPDGGRDAVRDVGSPSNANRHGLFFQGLDGAPQLVSTAALEQTFGAAGSSVKLVVFNACYSDVQAGALLAHVDCVVGMRGSIPDRAARNFAVGFYGGIGERESIAAAYRQGRAAISLEGLRDHEIPQLKVREGVDAEQLILAAARPEAMKKPPETSLRESSARSFRSLTLTFISGKYEGAMVGLPTSGIVRIGRASGLEVVLVDEMVSRRHAQIQISNGTLTLSDQGSMLGSFVNGERIVHMTHLAANDRILFGTSVVKLTNSTRLGLSLEEAESLNEQRTRTGRDSQKAISRTLEYIPIETLLRLLSTTGRSGVLTIQAGLKVGKVYFVRGEIVGADFEKGTRRISARDALFEFYSWRAGAFEFIEELFDAASVPGAIAGATEELLMEGLAKLRLQGRA